MSEKNQFGTQLADQLKDRFPELNRPRREPTVLISADELANASSDYREDVLEEPHPSFYAAKLL